ncbi:MAG TPA: L-2-hydroxyglutarate oxidase [Actinopolymorphaceae bacterium]
MTEGDDVAHVVVVGAGIVGLAVADRLAARGDRVTVVEKESSLAQHQTGRNSGVIHSGLYYPPGSLKARMCVAGSASMLAFARTHGVAVERCGKLVVAVEEDERAALHRLADRARTNGVPARLIGPSEIREIEPHVAAVEALWVESTGIIDYRQVCQVLAGRVEAAGGEIRFGTSLVGAAPTGNPGLIVATDRGDLQMDGLIVCAGLHADRMALACGLVPQARIVPFRGEYFELTERAARLVSGLVYPVPDPRFPFLGVHLTRMIHGGVHAGPNAVLALAREGYRWRDVDLRDLRSALSWPGLWRLGRGNVGAGARELIRSVSKRVFARSLARLVPDLRAGDLVASPAGVRAQALTRGGRLVDDFLVQSTHRQVHVLNAPSPAATAALEIAPYIVAELDGAIA